MGVEEDFAEFVAARWASLYRLAYLLAGSSAGAEDLLQTTLEKAYMSWSRVARMDFPEAYVRRILANTAASGRRRAWRGERPTEVLPEGPEGSGVSVEEPLLDRRLFWPLVCALPARQRAVIVLRYYEDLSEAQIADVLGCAPGTVKSQSSAAIGALRRALAASGVGEAIGES
jgi:RNA polymerase sigma-70 factor (sigma-E family)